jgi:hypothetical protein
MSASLPSPLSSYFAGQNAHDVDGMLAPFSDTAVVKDEGQEYRGARAIRGWMEETTRRYRPMVEVKDVEDAGGITIATVIVSGQFPGSPVTLRYEFALAGHEIARLEIT